MGEVISVVVGKIVHLLFSAVTHEINYVRNCTKNVDKLRNEAQNLKDMKGRIQQRIDVAKDKGERLLEGVRNWLDKANDEILKAEEFLEEEANANKKCFNLQFCVDLGAVRRYSKIAKDKTYLLSQHLEDGNKHFETGVSVPIPALSIVDLYQRKNLEHMNSQKFTLGKIIQALEDENIQTVGIYGLGGVGKTTIAKEVAAKMKNQFAGIVFIVVSQTIDCKMIQDKVDVAAKQVINGEKVLIILDDVWEDLVLPDLGIPCGNDYMNCKILLTSRSKIVCEAMNVDSSICVSSLTRDEAWILFKRVVGDRVETDVELRLIATEVTDECGGLPLIIQAIGNALRNKSVNLWEAALDRLKKHAPLDIAPEIRKAFTHLKLSYDLLESEEAKSCFLLCSMFKEDELIDLESLVEYGVGLGIFNNLDSIQDARHRVQIAVDTLKSSFLLLSMDEEVFMHDVVRDVALLITSKGKEKFLVMAGKELMEWRPRNNTSESYTKISLMHNKIRELPDNELYFPLLDTFLIQYNQVEIVPNEFFRAMKEVKVLDISGNNISSLPQSLKLLTKLCSLNLSFNRSLHEISILGDLKDLEILKLRGTGIRHIPKEIGQLTNLRLLDVDICKSLSYVTPGVISKLKFLEMLHIGFFLEEDGKYNCIRELSTSNLKSLKTLHLRVLDCDLIPEDAHFETLTEFCIHIGRSTFYSWYQLKPQIKCQLQITRSNISFTTPVKKLIQASDVITLEWIKHLDNIVPALYPKSFDELKYICLRNCHNVSCLVKTRDPDAMDAFVASNDLDQGKRREKFFSQVEEILLERLPRLELLWDCPNQYIYFHNLVKIKIIRCSSLLTIFPVSVAQGLANMKYLDIRKCNSLVEVISTAGEQKDSSETKVGIHDADIVFPCLTNLVLCDLPKLKIFYSGHSTIKYPSWEFINVIDCPSMKIWGYGVHDIPKIDFQHQGTSCSINDIITLHHEMNENTEYGTLR